MATRDWDDLAPASGDPVAEGDDRIRDTRVDIRERLIQGGHFQTDSARGATNQNTDGRHVVDVGPDGGPHVYKADNSTKLIDFDTPDAVDMSNASAGVLGPNITSETDPGHLHVGTVALKVSGTIVSATTLRASWRVPKGITFTRMSINVFQAPVGAPLTVTARRLNTPAIGADRLSPPSSTDLFDVGSPGPSILDGNNAASVTAFLTTTASAGDEIQWIIGTHSWSTDPQDLTINLDFTHGA